MLQPRVTPTLPTDREGSLFQRIFSGPGGIDPYASIVSDVYQDLLAEGSYIGKGIYDVDAFEAALAGRVPENALLSHDLFEGIFARAGLVTDIEFFDESPSHYEVAAARQHRWARGDWQLLPWIIGHARDPSGGQSTRQSGRRVPIGVSPLPLPRRGQFSQQQSVWSLSRNDSPQRQSGPLRETYAADSSALWPKSAHMPSPAARGVAATEFLKGL